MKKLYKQTLIFTTSFMFSVAGVNAQNVGVNATGAAPDAGAMLDISSTNKGLLIPRVDIVDLTTIAPITGSTTTSMLVYNTRVATGVGYHYWDGADWIPLTKKGDDWSILGNAGTVAGTNFLGTTDNVSLAFKTNNTEWVRFLNTGEAYFAHEILLRDGGTTGGDILARIYDSADDGIIDIYENNTMNIRLHGNGVSIFNDQQINTNDFLVKTTSQNDMFFIDAGNNRIGINNAAPSNQIHYVHDGAAAFSTLWEENTNNGALMAIAHNPAGNANRVVVASTNYNGSAFQASALVGISLNNTTTGSGGNGVLGAANNESGNAVEGSLYFVGGYTGWAGYFNADVFSGGTYWGSDRRLKRDINPITEALEMIKKIEPVSYYMDTEKYPGIGYDENRLSYGFIAQDIEKVIPEMVKEKNLVLNSNVEKTAGMKMEKEVGLFKVVNYTLMIPIAVEAIKEQQAIIESQEERIKALELKVEQLLNSK
jgi:hypothetical protein